MSLANDNLPENINEEKKDQNIPIWKQQNIMLMVKPDYYKEAILLLRDGKATAHLKIYFNIKNLVDEEPIAIGLDKVE